MLMVVVVVAGCAAAVCASRIATRRQKDRICQVVTSTTDRSAVCNAITRILRNRTTAMRDHDIVHRPAEESECQRNSHDGPNTCSIGPRRSASTVARRLTELRRDLLGLILDAASPTGAYDLLDRLRPKPAWRSAAHRLSHTRFPARTGPDPPGRAAVGVRRLRGRLHGPTPGGDSHTHAAQFLICRECGRVVEMQDHHVSMVLARAAKDAGFSITNATGRGGRIMQYVPNSIRWSNDTR